MMSKPRLHAPDSSDEMRESLHRRMLSSVSHDLKTPLATIIGSLEIYQRMQEKLTLEKKEALINSCLNEAYRLDCFITNILDMAKLESNAVTPRREWCDIDYLLHDCIIRLGPKREQCDISIQPSNGASKKALADPMLLGRAVSLLLDNAIKYGGKTAVKMEYGDENDAFFIRVRDHGPGIPDGKEEEIFAKYIRYHHADYQNAGTGLGLSICRELMRLLGGKVQAGNHPSGGAIFTLSYPQELERVL